jgi:hypothetical protein
MKVQHFALCAVGLVLVLAVVSLFDPSWGGLLPLLVLLGCPLMMLVTMRGMDHGSGHGHGSRDGRGAGDHSDLPPARRDG